MSAANATIFPLQNQPFPCPVSFRDTSGNLITGWAGAQSIIVVDRAAAVAGAAPVEIGTTGYGYLDLTQAQMNGQIIGIVCTITNTNATAFCGAIFTYPAWSVATGTTPNAQGYNSVRPTDMLGRIGWIFSWLFNNHAFTRSTGLEQVYDDSNNVLTTGQTIGSDVQYTGQKFVP